MDNVREPRVSGLFYPGDKAALSSMIRDSLEKAEKHTLEGRPIGAVVPHAGYVYSGVTAAHVYGSVDFRSRKILLIGPNHNSFPPHASLFTGGIWKTPLGNTVVSEETVKKVAGNLPALTEDDLSHSTEHSLEVQLPFLQYVAGTDFEIVPVILGDQSINTIRTLAEQAGSIVPEFFILASSDLNHYENEIATEEKDRKMIEAIISLNLERFYSVIKKERATPCGFGAIGLLMVLTRKLGGRIMELHHTTSAEASGDRQNTVGYCSLVALVD